MPFSKTVPTRFLIISDTHCIPPTPAHSQYSDHKAPYRTPLPRADVLLHCGDISNEGNLNEYAPVFAALKAADAEVKIVIAGNHDLSLDEKFIRKRVGWEKDDQELVAKAREMWTGREAKENGIVYLEVEIRTFTLKSGATFTVYASPYTPEFCGWAFPYPRHEDRFNPASPPASSDSHTRKLPIPDFPAIDVILTHGPPKGILDVTLDKVGVGCSHLRRALERAKPKLCCFGHIHEAWGAQLWDWEVGEGKKVYAGSEEEWVEERRAYVDARGLKVGKETLCVNAAIMNLHYRPRNAPWLVDLELRVEEGDEAIEAGGELMGDEGTEGKAEEKMKMMDRDGLENPAAVPIDTYP